jgi:hypothetical protein
MHTTAPAFRALLAVSTLAVALTACQSVPEKPALPQSDLKLLRSAPLQLPATCTATSSIIVDFTVLESGQTDNIRPASGPECLQQALTAWVASFRYAPVTAQMPSSVEWLLVEAKKGS